MARTQIREDIREILRDVIIPTLDIATPCGGPGWTLAASLNMTDPTQNCPSAWDERTESGKRVCFRQPSSSAGCDSVTFPTDGKEYTHVCGRAVGYQYASADAFRLHSGGSGMIDAPYVDGLSVTHGQPGSRAHIWTFVAGIVNPGNVPSYVAGSYFCELGIPYLDHWSTVLYADNPLWDGVGCRPDDDCCSFNSPPWFTAELPTPTTDDIEVRNCGDQGTHDEDMGIELIEFYIR